MSVSYKNLANVGILEKKAFFGFFNIWLNLKMDGEPKVPILQIYSIHLKIILSYINWWFED